MFCQNSKICPAFVPHPIKRAANGPDRTYVETIHMPKQITGYEYQFLACRQALIEKRNSLLAINY